MLMNKFEVNKLTTFCLLLTAFCLLSVGCRYDMQDTPRYEVYEQSDFYPDQRASREAPEGTVARGNLRENKAFYTGQKPNADPNVQVQTTTDASGNTLVTSFPNAIEEFPIPVTKEMIDRGQERYNIYCIVCHGPVGSGDGMIVRRGYPQPPSYHTERLQNAPVGHFYDVITNGWGRMNSYAGQIPVADRWAIVAYIRALQISQNPNANITMTTTTGAGTTNSNAANTNTGTTVNPPNANANTMPQPKTPVGQTEGGAR